jgi:hypothetical protein
LANAERPPPGGGLLEREILRDEELPANQAQGNRALGEEAVVKVLDGEMAPHLPLVVLAKR